MNLVYKNIEKYFEVREVLLSLHRFGKQVKQLTSDKQNGSVVQLVRMPPCHGGGRGFESRPDRKVKRSSREI